MSIKISITLKNGERVEVKKIFKMYGYEFAVHRPVVFYMNSDKPSIMDKYWCVSELTTGGGVHRSSVDWGKTSSAAIEKAISLLTSVGKDRFITALSKDKQINV